MFILARTAHGRPSLQHVLVEDFSDETRCGLDVSQWSRAYQATAIKEILCKKCGKSVGES